MSHTLALGRVYQRENAKVDSHVCNLSPCALQSMNDSLVENLGREAKRHLSEAVAERVRTVAENRNRFSRNYPHNSRQYATPLAPPVSASKFARAEAVA